MSTETQQHHALAIKFVEMFSGVGKLSGGYGFNRKTRNFELNIQIEDGDALGKKFFELAEKFSAMHGDLYRVTLKSYNHSIYIDTSGGDYTRPSGYKQTTKAGKMLVFSIPENKVGELLALQEEFQDIAKPAMAMVNDRIANKIISPERRIEAEKSAISHLPEDANSALNTTVAAWKKELPENDGSIETITAITSLAAILHDAQANGKKLSDFDANKLPILKQLGIEDFVKDNLSTLSMQVDSWHTQYSQFGEKTSPVLDKIVNEVFQRTAKEMSMGAEASFRALTSKLAQAKIEIK